MKVTSTAFADNGRIPLPYVSVRGGGEDRSFPLDWSDAPTDTASFAVAIVDHAPIARMWLHWLVVDIPPGVTYLPDGASRTSAIPVGARELRNTAGGVGYAGPMPPVGSGDHPYVATVYALSVPKLDIAEGAGLAGFETAIAGKVLASASVTGVYTR